MSQNPERNAEFLKRQLSGHTPLELLSTSMRLPALSELQEKVSPATLQSLLALEPHNKNILSHVNFFIGRFPEGMAFVDRLIDLGSAPSHFDGARLSAHLNLESRFGRDSDVMSRLLALEKMMAWICGVHSR